MSVNLGSAYAEMVLDTTKFQQGLKNAKSDLNGFSKDIDSVASTLQSAGKSIEGAGKKLTKTVTVPIVGLGAAAVKTTSQFDSAMSQVYATMGDKAQKMVEYNGKTVSSMEALRDYAQQMGATTKFTASQAADALNYMALAGYDAKTSMEMLPNVLNLAAAGNMELATASDMVTDTQTAFGISLERTKQMVDEMAKAASTGNTNVEQLGEAFLTVGGLAQEMSGGMITLSDGTKAEVDNVQELEIALTAMANAGIKGSEAGTHMRNMLLKLASPTKEGKETFEQLGVSIFDAEGNMRSLADIMTDLNGSFENLTQQQKLEAISNIFNTRDTASAEALLKAVGEDWNYIGQEILNAEGAADRMSATQLDNLNGQLTILKSSIEGLMIQIGDILMPYLTKITEKIQKLVTYLLSLDEQQKQQIAKWLALAAAIGPALLVVGKLTSSVGKAIGLFSKMATVIPAIATQLGLVTAGTTGLGASLGAIASAAAPILAVVAAVAALGVGLKELYDQGGEFKESVDSLIGTLRDDLMGVFEYLESIFGPVIEGVKAGIDTIKSSFGNLAGSVDGPMSRVVELIHTIHDALVPIVEFLLNTLRPALTIMSTNIQLVMSVAMGVISGLLAALGPFIDTVVSYFTVIVDEFKVVLAFFKGVVTGDFTDFRAAVAKLWNDIKELVHNFINTIKAFLSAFAKTFFASFKKFLSDMLYNFGHWIGEMIVKVIDFFTNLKTDAPKKAGEVWKALKEFVRNFPDNFKKWLKEFPDRIAKAVPDMIQAGKDLMNGLWDGLKAIWDSIVGWFQGVVDTVKSFVQGIKDGMAEANNASSKVKGSHAGGLAYVPYDGYIAQLHEGERVLTRNENEALNSGNLGTRSGFTFIYNSPKAIDPYEANKLFKESMREVEEGFV